jgi:hypothetical protein
MNANLLFNFALIAIKGYARLSSITTQGLCISVHRDISLTSGQGQISFHRAIAPQLQLQFIE